VRLYLTGNRYRQQINNTVKMESDDDACAAAVVLNLVKRRLELTKRARKRRLLWSQPWISSRLQVGAYHALLDELRTTDAVGYRSFLRMDPLSFDLLLQKVGPLIRKADTRMRLSIPAEERLALTLRWMATG